METANTGAVRSTLFEKGVGVFPIRLNLMLLNDVGIRRLGATYGEGEQKYGPKNWKKGFEESVYLAHAQEHLLRHVSGDTSEDHLAHALWNIMTLMWIQEKKPELLNLTGDCNVANPIAEDPLLVKCKHCGLNKSLHIQGVRGAVTNEYPYWCDHKQLTYFVPVDKEDQT